MDSALEILGIKLLGDITDFSSKIDKATEKTNSFAGMAGKAIGGAVVGAAAIGAAGIAAIGTAAFNVSMQTEQASASIAASLGLPIAEAEKFGEVARQVYGNNFADDVNDAGVAVGAVAKQFKLAANDPSLKRITEQALAIKDTFGTDVTESLSAAQSLMENFGVSSDEAFDLLTKGYQKGLDRSGDFLDTIGEYSVQFASGGASAEQFFSVLDSGLQGGMLGTDKAADMFKEFRVRIQDGSSLTAESLAMIGIDAEMMAARMADGSLTAAEAFTMVQTHLAGVTDENVRLQAGVGLLGTQFEDLGTSAALGVSLTSDAFANIGGATDSLNAKYATLGDAATGIWRRLVVAVSPFTDKLLDLVNSAMPALMATFDRLEASIGPTLDILGSLSNYFQIVGEDGDYLNDHLSELPESMQGIVKAAGMVIEWFQGLSARVSGNTETFGYFKSWIDTNMPLVQELVGKVLGAITAFWDAHGDAIMTVITNTMDTVFTVIDTVLKTVLDLVTLTLQLLNGDWEAAGETMAGIVTRIWDTVVGIVSNQLDSIWTLVTDIDWMELGRSIVQDMIDGIVGMSTALWQAADTLSQNLWDRMTGWWDSNSPSKVSMELGGSIGQGIGLGVPTGITDVMGQVDRGMASLFDGMAGAELAGSSGGSSGGSITLTQNFYGQTDPTAVRTASENGVRSALRAVGA